MTITRLLEIERRLLSDVDDLGLRFAETLWISAGSPVEGIELCRAIESILLTCEREGVHYPAILLRRKKELERGTWKPRAAPAARTPYLTGAGVSARLAVLASAAMPAPPQVPGAKQVSDAPQNNSQASAACKLCGGSGIVVSADRQTGRACECYLRRWARNPS